MLLITFTSIVSTRFLLTSSCARIELLFVRYPIKQVLGEHSWRLIVVLRMNITTSTGPNASRGCIFSLSSHVCEVFFLCHGWLRILQLSNARVIGTLSAPLARHLYFFSFVRTYYQMRCLWISAPERRYRILRRHALKLLCIASHWPLLRTRCMQLLSMLYLAGLRLNVMSTLALRALQGSALRCSSHPRWLRWLLLRYDALRPSTIEGIDWHLTSSGALLTMVLLLYDLIAGEHKVLHLGWVGTENIAWWISLQVECR